MLGTAVTVADAKRVTARENTDLAEYVRWEYGQETSVAAFIANAADVSEKARTKDRRGAANLLRKLARAFGSALGARRSPEAEV